MTDATTKRKALAPQRNQPEAPPRRRLLGPWTALALSAGIFLVWHDGLVRTSHHPVIMPPRIITSDATAFTPSSVSILLKPGSPIKLTPAQRTRIRHLAAVEATTEKSRLAQLEADREVMDRLIRRARSNGGASLSLLQTTAAPMVADSAELSRERQNYWRQAMDVLTPGQRRMAARGRR